MKETVLKKRRPIRKLQQLVLRLSVNRTGLCRDLPCLNPIPELRCSLQLSPLPSYLQNIFFFFFLCPPSGQMALHRVKWGHLGWSRWSKSLGRTQVISDQVPAPSLTSPWGFPAQKIPMNQHYKKRCPPILPTSGGICLT